MALVNPNIAMSFRQPEFRPRNAMAEYAQMQQIEGGQRQAEVADMQLESLRRERDALSQIQAAIVAKGGPPDLDAAADAMIKTGRPEYVTQGMAIHTARRNQRQAEAYYRNFSGGAPPAMPSSTPGAMVAPAAPAELAAGAQPESMAPVPGVISASRVPGVVTAPITAPMGTMREIAPGGGMGAEMPLAPATANALAPAVAAAPVNAMLAPAPAAAPAAPDANAARLRALEAQYRQIGNNPELASERALVLKQIEAAMRGDQNRPLVVGNRLVSPTGQELFASPERTDTDLIRNFNAAKAQGFKGNLFDYQREIAMASRPPAPPRQEPPPQPPVAVIDPASGNTIFVSREEALNKRMTPAGQGVSLTPKQMQTFEAKYPQATAAVKTFESKSDRLAADLETLANHPGLSGISGLIYGRTPALTAEARQAEALYDSIIARGGFQELQDMRAASPTGGALGPVSNTENQYLRDAFAPIKRTQDTPDLKQALLNAAQATNDSKQRIREAYDLTYEYRAQRGAKPAGGATGSWSVVR